LLVVVLKPVVEKFENDSGVGFRNETVVGDELILVIVIILL